MSRQLTPWLNGAGTRCLPVIRQSAVAECGLACLAMIAGYFGSEQDLASLRRRFGASMQGASLASLIRISESLHLSARAVRCRLAEIKRLQVPCILHWKFDHFVVLSKATNRHVVVHDPARGVLRISLEEADALFTGIALELAPAKEFARSQPLRRLRLGEIVTLETGFTAGISAGLLLAVLSELLLLAMPFYLQTVIDQVLMRGDHLLLNTLVIGFATLAVFQLVASGTRQLTFQFLSQAIVFSLSSRVLRHLLRLPVAWFRARRLGDIQQRLASLARIQAFVTVSAPALILDGIFLVIVTVLMLAYAPALTALVAAMGATYPLWRILIFPVMLEQANRLVHAEAAAQTHLLESLRSMQSIKMCAGEHARTTAWQNLFVRRINTQIRAGNTGVIDRSISQALQQGLHIGIVYLLARRVLDGEMTVGAVSAFVAYTGMFMARASGIINRLVEYRLLQVPLERLADIVFADVETRDSVSGRGARLGGKLQASDLCFAYAGSDRPVLRNISFSASRGEFVAIRGPSGCGKSTLLRLLAGVEQATSGNLYYDDRPCHDWPLVTVRRSIATVFHDDVLVAGSIAENIALFDASPDDTRIQEAARLAAIDDSIERLPMSYNTRIGDLGSALSTGQVQRILFARALYRRPSILLLDEFTSGLDEDTERRVMSSVACLPVTRVVVTHSAAVLRAADRVLDLSNGGLQSR